MSDYEKDMEVVWETARLEKLISKAKDRVAAHDELKVWLEAHPEFKEFYNLMKRSESY